MEFIVQDKESDRLENAEIIVKLGNQVLVNKNKTNTNGMFKMNSTVHLGSNLTVQVSFGNDIITKHFLVGEPEDNTHDQDHEGTKTFIKYLQLKNTKAPPKTPTVIEYSHHF